MENYQEFKSKQNEIEEKGETQKENFPIYKSSSLIHFNKTEQLEQIMSVGALSSEESIGQVSQQKIKERASVEEVQSLKSLIQTQFEQIGNQNLYQFKQQTTPNTTITTNTPEKTSISYKNQKQMYDEGRRRTKSSINPSEYLKQCGKKDLKLSILLNNHAIEDLDKTQMFKKQILSRSTYILHFFSYYYHRALEKHRLNQLGSPNSNISVISNNIMRNSFFTPGNQAIKKDVPFSEMVQSQVNSKLRQSFSTSSRKFNVSQISQTPSPADYDITKCDKQIRPKSPGQSFSKSPRLAWVDNKIKREGNEYTPGPDYNYKKSNLSSPSGLSVKKIATSQGQK